MSRLSGVGHRLRLETDRLDERQRILGHRQNERHDRGRNAEIRYPHVRYDGRGWVGGGDDWRDGVPDGVTANE